MSAPPSALAERLCWGIDQLGLTLPEGAPRQLLDYLAQLQKWNKAYNLSGIRDEAQMLDLHILDSLALVPYIDAGRIADVGTGAGLPGIPLAICNPEKHFSLIDSNSKKTRFIFQTAALLGLRNVEVIHCRVEDYASNPQVAIVTSRAFASLADFVIGCQHLLGNDIHGSGKFLAMKGHVDDAEIQALPRQFKVAACHRLTIPGTSLTRHLIEIRRSSLTTE
jgi:16S rRNA (guanine527-N7)-methyltransferase